MISEIVNSLFLTYLASEYVLSSPLPSSSSSSRSRTLKSSDSNNSIDEKRKAHKDNYAFLGVLVFLVGVANLLDHHYYLSVIWGFARKLFPSIPSYIIVIPSKIFVAAASYVLALYVDIHRVRKAGPNGDSGKNQTSSKHRTKKLPFRSVFLPKVGWAFLKILPAYPFLAVLVSFVFLFVVDLWEFLHLPLEWLNNPIYYGTLYGPFAYTYVHVKQEVLRGNNFSYDGQRIATYSSQTITEAFV